VVRAHQHAAGSHGGQEREALGRSRGGFTTKIHVKTDALGYPVKFLLSSGEAADINYAQELIGTEKSEYLIADRGYDSNELRAALRSRDTEPVIPGRSNRLEPIKYDKHIYGERNKIERLFNRMKHFRRIATRYEKSSRVYQAFLSLFGILKWLDIF
jgi:transposase